MKHPSLGRQFKRIAALILVLLVLGAWMFYMGWASRVARQTILMAWIPEWTTYVVFGVVTGLYCAFRPERNRPPNSTNMSSTNKFLGGFSLGFVFLLNSYAVCVYLLPGEVIHYKSVYEIRFPGPAYGKYSRCEAGLWIKDLHTERDSELCTTRSELDDQIKRGMTVAWVTARTNTLGTYIINHTFTYP